MTDKAKNPPRIPAAWTAAALALFFLFLELMKAYRSSQWSGTTPQDAFGILAGGVAYSLILYLFLRILTSVLLRLRLPGTLALALAAFCSGGAVWAFLSRYREFSPTLDDAMVLSGLFFFSAGLAATAFFRRISLAAFCALAAGSLAAGIAALAAAGYYSLFDAHRAEWVTVTPLAWAGIAGAIGLLTAAFLNRWARGLWAGCALVLPIAATGMLTRAPLPAPDPQRPNLLFIISDSMRADYLSAYGGPVPTPNLDSLAGRGVLFEHSYSLAPWTMPSMSALFSSSYPPGLTPQIPGDQWLTQIWQYAVDEKNRALAESARERGYATAALTANALLWSMPGILNGFETQARSHPILLDQEGLFNHLPFLQAALSALCPALDGLRPNDTTADMNHYAKAWLRRFRDKPFFLWLHYIDPHAPYDPPRRFRSQDGAWPFFFPFKGGERWNIPILSPEFKVDPADQPYVKSLYEGEIRYIDESVGMLLKELEALGVREHTYICFTSDHGEELWDHGDWGHGHTVYQELVHVPLIFAGPGLPPSRIPAPVSALDLFPTLAGLLNTPPEPGWRGRSLLPVLRGETTSPEGPIFAQGTSNRSWPEPQQAVVEKGFKLIRESGSGKARLFDLNADPGETHDAASQFPEQAQALAEKLIAWMKTFPSTFPSPQEQGGAVNQQRLETLRGMGYL